MFCVISILILILIWAIYPIISSYKKQKVDEKTNVDKLIKELKIAIAVAEIKARNGQKEAEAELLQYQEELKKAEEYKQKTQNL